MGERGFTFLEILVVLAIIAILIAILQPQLFKQIEKSKVARAEAEYNAVKAAAFAYYSDTGQWPRDNQNQDFMMDPGGTVVGWKGPYLEKPLDKSPWGTDYTIKYDSTTFYLGDSTYYTQTSGNVCWLLIENVPLDSAEKIDIDLDGARDNYGIVKLDSPASAVTDVRIYIGGGV